MDGLSFPVNCIRIIEAFVGQSIEARIPSCSPATMVVTVDPSSEVIIGVESDGIGELGDGLLSIECSFSNFASGFTILCAAGKFSQI